MQHDYVSESSNEYVILGNDALMKCIMPSFVNDLVEVISWIETSQNVVYTKHNQGRPIFLDFPGVQKHAFSRYSFA